MERFVQDTRMIMNRYADIIIIMKIKNYKMYNNEAK